MSYPTGPFIHLRGRGEPPIFDEDDESFVPEQSSPNRIVEKSKRAKSRDGADNESKRSDDFKRRFK